MKFSTSTPLLLALTLALTTQTATWAAEAETGIIGQGGTQLEFKLGTVRDDQDSRFSLRERATPFLSASGWADISVGVRWRSHEGDEKTGAPSVAWQLTFGLPTGSSAFKSDGVSTTLELAGEWNLGDDTTIGVMPGLLRERNGNSEWFMAPSLAITLGKGWTPALRTTLEPVAPRLSSVKSGGNEATVNAGATYALTEMFELEAVYLRGITKNTPQTAFAFGVNVKF